MSGCEVENQVVLGGNGLPRGTWGGRRQEAAGSNRFNMLQPTKDVVTDISCR